MPKREEDKQTGAPAGGWRRLIERNDGFHYRELEEGSIR